MTENRESGTVKWFNTAKGFGFISRQSGEDAFVHHSEIRGQGFRNLAEGDTVEFGIVDTPKGPRATDVVRTGGAELGEPVSEGNDRFGGDSLSFF